MEKEIFINKKKYVYELLEKNENEIKIRFENEIYNYSLISNGQGLKRENTNQQTALTIKLK